jgi:hypothetical protein
VARKSIRKGECKTGSTRLRIPGVINKKETENGKEKKNERAKQRKRTINRKKYGNIVGFEVLTAVSTKMAVFWVVAPCSLVEVYQRFRGPCCLLHQGDGSSSHEPSP